MASLWNKTLFYLGLVDEEEQAAEPVDAATDSVAVTGAHDLRSRNPPPPRKGILDGAGLRVPVCRGGASSPHHRLADRSRVTPVNTQRRASTSILTDDVGVEQRSLGVRSRESPDHRRPQLLRRPDRSLMPSAEDAAVVLDLRSSTEPAMVRRIVDFASGLTYALDGKMAKTSQGVILVSAVEWRHARRGRTGTARLPRLVRDVTH